MSIKAKEEPVFGVGTDECDNPTPISDHQPPQSSITPPLVGFQPYQYDPLRLVFGSNMASSVIDRIQHIISQADDPELRIGLRILWMLLELRKSEIEAELRNHRLSSKPSSLLSLVFRIRRLVDVVELESEDSELLMLIKLKSLGKEVSDELWIRMTHSSLMTLIEMLPIALFVLESIPDLLGKLKFSGLQDVFLALDALEQNILNTLCFLLFAKTAGIELENLLFQIKPIVVNAAWVFVKDGASMWYKDEVRSNCLAVNRMASDPQLYQAYSQALTSSTLLAPSSLFILGDDQDELDNFQDSLVSILWDKLCQLHSEPTYQHDLKMLYERLRSTRSILGNHEYAKETMLQYQTLICEAGVFIYSYCSHHHIDSVLLSHLLESFDVFQAQVKLKTMSITAKEELICDDSPTPIWGHQPQQSSNFPPVVGFQLDEVNPILDQLTQGISKRLRIVQISGMAGIGKTTFALQLFNHPHVLDHFWCRAWCPVSQVFDKKKVLVQLLNQIQEPSGSNTNMHVDDLADKLRKSLKGRRYLILLDDVWEPEKEPKEKPEVWNKLKASFPDDSNGSRIIVTSRRHERLCSPDCALQDERPYSLRLRDDDECLMILEEKLKLKLKEGGNRDIGMRIAKMCKGLPLTLGVVAGVLATMEQGGWNGVLDQLGSGGVPTGAESAIELSYQKLPKYLQPCFLYFGVFPEDTNISVQRLIQLWMGEGFVGGIDDLSIQKVARKYVDMLVERSLVMVAESRSIGGVKKCRIHDLVHEFCRIKAKSESFFHLLQERRGEISDFNEPCDLQRLSIHSSAEHFKNSRLFCPGARSLLCFTIKDSFLRDVSFINQVFQLLNVLDIQEIFLERGIPIEIDRLTQLRYLSILSMNPVIPPSVGNLPYLETFRALFLTPVESLSFPQTLWNLKKLKFLYIRKSFNLPTENLENSSSLLELETLCAVAFDCDGGLIEKQMRKFPNLRRLNCAILPSVQSREVSHKIVVPEFPCQLETLTIRGSYELEYVFGSFPESLKKLKLVSFDLSKEDIEVIGKIPNLEVLKLSSIQFPKNILSMEEEGFQKLRILELDDIYTTLERWTTSEDQLPSLVKMVFKNCLKLKEIPQCLEMSATLEEIQVGNCSSTLKGLVKDVEKVQLHYGNSIKVSIISPSPNDVLEGEML